MYLARNAIIEAVADGRIFMDPWDESLVSNNSIDVAVGADGWVMCAERDQSQGSAGMARVRQLYAHVPPYQPEPVPTTTVAQCLRMHPVWVPPPGVAPDTEVLLLEAGKSYLLTTLQAIGTTGEPDANGKLLMPKMQAKSTAGRLGLTVALCAGVGEYGYHSRWALECRVAPNADGNGCYVPLVVGTLMGQVLFAQVEPGTSAEGNTPYDGCDRYQHGKQVRFLPKPMTVISPK